ncbi:MAG: tRNA (adenosine(37)-N6)-dimethylallyltransferase MiaA [Flavobacteriaceae bacterium]
MNNIIIHIGGPTASGKTSLAIELALLLGTEVISSDSRQCYKEMSIGTAVPTKAEQSMVFHHFIHSHSIHSPLTAGSYASEAGHLVSSLLEKYGSAVIVGGSPLYSDALLYGLDDFPKVDESILDQLSKQSLEELSLQIKELDPISAKDIDHQNRRRLERALSICLQTGKPYSSFKNRKRSKPFENIFEIGIHWERNLLYDRINSRVDLMFQLGLLAEVQSLIPFKDLKPLQTVGYSELFEYLEGKCSLDEATEKIKQHSRNFAKRQLTWYNKKPEFRWFNPGGLNAKEVLDQLSVNY